MKPQTQIAAQLKGLQAIGNVFGVGRNMVRQWAQADAPIFYVGRRYQANYTRLCLWLEEHYPAKEFAPKN